MSCTTPSIGILRSTYAQGADPGARPRPPPPLQKKNSLIKIRV